jgi:hypothetical protein
MRATGSFSVDLRPVEAYTAGGNGVSLGRLSIDKRFSGDLEATSRGEMLSAMTPVTGSAGYVAIEQVRGTLAGKEGSFVLQHYGMMDRGVSRLILEIVPDSGTGELAGISGSLAIEIVDGAHTYVPDYELDG